MSHTEGKLAVDHAMLFDVNGKEVALMLGKSEVFKPNARRMAACWNRFEGISTYDVENIVRVENKLRQERDEALEALYMAMQWIDSVPSNTQLPAMPGLDRDHVDAILAKHQKGNDHAK